MSIESRLKKLEQRQDGINEFDHIDVCFKDGNILTGVRRLWVNSSKPDEEFTPDEYKMEENGNDLAAILTAARKRAGIDY